MKKNDSNGFSRFGMMGEMGDGRETSPGMVTITGHNLQPEDTVAYYCACNNTVIQTTNRCVQIPSNTQPPKAFCITVNTNKSMRQRVCRVLYC